MGVLGLFLSFFDFGLACEQAFNLARREVEESDLGSEPPLLAFRYANQPRLH